MKKTLPSIFKIFAVIILASGVMNIISYVMALFNPKIISNTMIAAYGQDKITSYIFCGLGFGLSLLMLGISAYRSLKDHAKFKMSLVYLIMAIIIDILQNVIFLPLWKGPLDALKGLGLLVVVGIMIIYFMKASEKEG